MSKIYINNHNTNTNNQTDNIQINNVDTFFKDDSQVVFLIQIENNDNINALRESYHEFSLKKLMQMSFVEKRKQKALTNKLTPLTVETNSIKKNVLNGSTKDKDLKSQNEEEMEDSFCSVLKKNIVLIICSVLITALICIILLM